MKFTELTELADNVADKINRYVNVAVSYDHHPSGTKELRYKFYEESYTHGTLEFKSALALKSHMENILNPPTNEGIDVKVFGKIINGLVEDGILRGQNDRLF